MKHKFLFAVGAAIVAAAAVSVFVYVQNGNNAMDEFFNANVEALASDESTRVKQCYTKNWAGESEYTTFCNDGTSTSAIYPCSTEEWGRKGVASLCTL